MNYERYITVTVKFNDKITFRQNEFLENFKETFKMDLGSRSRLSNIESRLVEMIQEGKYGVEEFELSTKYKKLGNEPFEDWDGAYGHFDITRIDINNSIMIIYADKRTKKNLIV